MAKLASLASPRTKLAEIPADLVAKLVPMPSRGDRDKLGWSIDGYDTVTIFVYLPEGESLPKGGITLGLDDFDADAGTDKERRGRTVAAHNSPVEGGVMSVFIEGPSEMDFDSVTITA